MPGLYPPASSLLDRTVPPEPGLADTALRPGGRDDTVRRWCLPVLLAALVTAGAYTLGVRRASPQATALPGAVDIGFVRDMSIHHAQAVTLAMIALDRATVPAVRDLAEDIAMEQQREIGVMAAWLDQWNPPTTTAPPMSWMNHPTATAPGADPPMPGMATRADVARLAVSRGRQADAQFCRLMLAHHVGGLHMIEEVVERGQRPEVIRLAERMRTGQRREVALLQTLVAELDS